MGILYGSLPTWLIIKLFFVAGLFLYHLSLQKIFNQQRNSNFKWTSPRLRIWNEIATLFLVAIVMLAVVKQLLNALWGMIALVMLAVLLMLAIKIYKRYRKD